MKKIFGSVLMVFMMISQVWAAQNLIVADFDSGDPPNNLGGDFGTWNYDPSDDTQGCYFFMEPDDYAKPDEGFCVRLDYDVQSDKPAFNGFWMKLKSLDVSKYDTLSFWLKGDKNGKNTTRFKVELKDSTGRRVIYPVENITSEWKEVKIAFKDTTSEINWTRLDEFVIVFDDIVVTYREGTIYMDQISFRN